MGIAETEASPGSTLAQQQSLSDLAIRHLLGHVQQQPAVAFIDAAQKPAEAAQKTRIFSRAAPGDIVRGSSASEDWAARAVLRRRRTAGRAELPSLAPASRASRSPVRCGRFRRAKCSSEEVRCAFRCRPGKVFLFLVAGGCDLRLSWRVLLHGVFYCGKTKVSLPA